MPVYVYVATEVLSMYSYCYNVLLLVLASYRLYKLFETLGSLSSLSYQSRVDQGVGPERLNRSLYILNVQ